MSIDCNLKYETTIIKLFTKRNILMDILGQSCVVAKRGTEFVDVTRLCLNMLQICHVDHVSFVI